MSYPETDTALLAIMTNMAAGSVAASAWRFDTASGNARQLYGTTNDMTPDGSPTYEVPGPLGSCDVAVGLDANDEDFNASDDEWTVGGATTWCLDMCGVDVIRAYPVEGKLVLFSNESWEVRVEIGPFLTFEHHFDNALSYAVAIEGPPVNVPFVWFASSRGDFGEGDQDHERYLKLAWRAIDGSGSGVGPTIDGFDSTIDGPFPTPNPPRCAVVVDGAFDAAVRYVHLNDSLSGWAGAAFNYGVTAMTADCNAMRDYLVANRCSERMFRPIGSPIVGRCPRGSTKPVRRLQ